MKNLDEKQTTIVSDTEKLLKSKGYIRQTFASASNIYQPRVTQVNVKIHAEEISLKEKYKQVHSAKASTSKSEVKLETLEGIIPEIKFEIVHTTPISLIDTFTSENEESFSIPTIIYTKSILFLLEVKFFVSKNIEDYSLYLDSFPIASPIYTSGKSERLSSSSLFPPRLCLPSPYNHLSELHSHHPEVVKISIDQYFEVFDNFLFSLQILSPRISKVGVGGAGGRGVGDHENIPVRPPRIFAKVTARYAPLVLPTILHDLPENYMKSLPKFMGEGVLTTT
jgi:hypothetical protein